MDQRAAVAGTTSPTRTVALFRRVFRPIWSRVGITAELEVPGRRTGAPVRATVIPWEVDGARYLLSIYGETDWVRNLRAAGRGQLRRKGRAQAFTAIEVDGDERDKVIAALHAKSPKPVRQDFDQRAGATDHPTSRVEPIR